MYKLYIYLSNGFNAVYRNLSMKQVLKELERYDDIETVSVMLED